MVNMRKYQDADFKPVLDLLQRSFIFDTLTDELLYEKLYNDPDWNPASTLVSVEGDRLIGFMQGLIRCIGGEKYAYLKLFATDPAFRRQGVAGEMLKILEKYFKEASCIYFRLMDVPLNYFMPGIDPRYTEAVCFALNSGFVHKGEAVNMKVGLNSSSWNTTKEIERLNEESIVIRRVEKSDTDSLLALIKRLWPLWENEVRAALAKEQPAVFVALKDDKVQAFAAYDGNNAGTGWFGPMGTTMDLRGKGIGSILLYLCLEDMKNSGLQETTIPWVDPVSFYSHYTGARIDRVFWRFEKQLKK